METATPTLHTAYLTSVSEELSSVETEIRAKCIEEAKKVSEELSSVETESIEGRRRYKQWVSEELSSVETRRVYFSIRR